MALYRCGMGKSSGTEEIIDGSFVGQSSGYQYTVTSQKGKAPKRVLLWNDTSKDTQYSNQLCWISPNTYTARMYNHTASSAAIGAATANATVNIASIGSDSVTFQLPLTTNYYSGTWRYTIVFA